MIVFAAFLPHTPLLMPSVGKEHRKKLKKTLPALATLAASFAKASPETVVIISAHPTEHANAFSINVHDPYRTDLSKFGDLGTNRSFVPDLGLIDTVQRQLRRAGLPLTLDTDHTLDHGATVPLLLLAPAMRPEPKVVAITYSGLGPKEHAAFGRALRDAFEASGRRIAVVASGDLSHALTKKSPLGARPEGKAFDDAVTEAVANLSLSQLLSLEPSLIEQAAECCYRPLLILFGVLEKMSATPRVLSYEAPFGVGYLTAHFDLPLG